jgi:hypothetical protein
MAKGHATPSHIHVELALLALQSAIAGIRSIDENDISKSEIRDHLPAVLDELDKATYFLSQLKNLPTPTCRKICVWVTTRDKDGSD